MIFDPPTRSFGGYIFDCDGTLADSMVVHHRAWLRALAQHGATFDFNWELFVSRATKLELARAVAIFASTICNFLAVRFLPVTVTGSIQFTTPLIVCMLSIPLLGEQVGWRRWSAIAVGFIGVLVVIRPGASDFNPAVLISLAGSTAGGFYTILVRRLAGTDSAATQQFYSSILAVCCMLPFSFGVLILPDDDFT